MRQEIISTKVPLEKITEISANHNIKRFMLVCDSAFKYLSTFEEYNRVKNIVVNHVSATSKRQKHKAKRI